MHMSSLSSYLDVRDGNSTSCYKSLAAVVALENVCEKLEMSTPIAIVHSLRVYVLGQVRCLGGIRQLVL